MKFKYKLYNSTLRPVIPLRLRRNNVFVSCEVLVDSGADICLFNENLGEALGIDVRKGKACELFGVGGKASVFFMHNIIIEVGENQYKIEAGFMPNVAGNIMPYGLVGQKGFFEKFIVKVDLLNEEVEFKRREN